MFLLNLQLFQKNFSKNKIKKLWKRLNNKTFPSFTKMNLETALMTDIKESILKKSKAFFMKAGVKSPSMDDIARQLTISKKTLYQHFTNKQDLLAQIFTCEETEGNDRIEKIHAASKNAIDETIMIGQFVMDDLKQLMLSLPTVYEIRKYYNDVWLNYESKVYDYIYLGVHKNLERGKLEGLYRPEINSDMVAKFYVQSAQNIVKSDIFPDDKYYKPHIYREFLVYHLNGIATPKGLKILEAHLNQL